MICGSCGHANEEGDNFCFQCGRPLAASPVRSTQQSWQPAGGSLETSLNKLGIPTKPGMLKAIVVASVVGLIVQYGVLPFVGFGAFTGGDATLNTLAMGFVTFVVSFGVAYMMRGGRRPART